MAVHIRLARAGTKKRPFYRVVVTDQRSPRGGKFLENIGTFDPAKETKDVPLKLDTERLALKVVDGDDPSVITHDPTNRGVAAMLILMPPDSFPVALGVIYENPAPTFESAVREQNTAAASGKTADLQALVAKGQTWMVEKEPREL